MRLSLLGDAENLETVLGLRASMSGMTAIVGRLPNQASMHAMRVPSLPNSQASQRDSTPIEDLLRHWIS